MKPVEASSVEIALLQRLAHLERLAVRLDSQYRVPGTQIRFGLDPVLGLVPVVGDLCMAAIGTKIIIEARKMGVPHSVLFRMIGQTSLDLLIGMVPIAGPIADAFYRTNERNFHLLLEHLARRDPA